jgi:hypothetical protein
MLRSRIRTEVHAVPSPGDERAEFVAAPGRCNRPARGAIAGVLLGTGLWGAILVLVGVIKL